MTKLLLRVKSVSGLVLGIGCLIVSLVIMPPAADALPLLRSIDLAETPPASVEELQKQRQQIEQERSHINQEHKQVQTQEKSAQEQLSGLHETINATSAEIAKNEKKLQAANKALEKLQVELAKAETQYQGRQVATVARLRFLQRQQNSEGWAVLLQSKNMNEFLERRYQLRRIYDTDRTILAQLKDDTDRIERDRRTVENKKNEIALLNEQLSFQKANYQAQAKTQEAQITRLRQNRQALEAAEDQLAQDSNNLAALIQQRIATASGNGQSFIWGAGLMSYPCNGTLTSGFGYRVHPILGYSRFHSGIDLGADYGSAVWAAKAGRVIFAGWYGGYGQAVILDHGDNISTLYGHLSKIYVSEGQTVQRGQVIAAVGSTGLSTGPHLHFEVRVSGEPTNPLSYL
jgi:murein DD-endopeptidase MepM/ murein hydrolase activator NlpD